MSFTQQFNIELSVIETVKIIISGNHHIFVVIAEPQSSPRGFTRSRQSDGDEERRLVGNGQYILNEDIWNITDCVVGSFPSIFQELFNIECLGNIGYVVDQGSYDGIGEVFDEEIDREAQLNVIIVDFLTLKARFPLRFQEQPLVFFGMLRF